MQTKPVVSRAKAYLKARQKNVRNALKELKLDGLLLTHPPDLAYLTNFTGDDSVGLITEKDFTLVTDFRYQEQAEQEAGWLKQVLREGKMSDILAKTLINAKVKRVGFEANFTTFGQVHAIDKAIQATEGAKSVELVPLEDVMTSIRKMKDDNEVDLIRKSVGVAEEAFEAIRSEIKEGQAENYLAGQVYARLDRYDHSGAKLFFAADLPHRRQFVNLAANAVTETVAEFLAEARLFNDIPRDLVGLSGGHTGAEERDRGLLGLVYGLINLFDLAVHPADHQRARQVAAIAFVKGAPVDQQGLVALDERFAGTVVGQRAVGTGGNDYGETAVAGAAGA